MRRPSRVFLLSPASCAGKRAQLLFNPRATFSVAMRLRESGGVPLGEAFSFLSGLYFRGKLAYATRFGRPPTGSEPAFIITTNRGLMPPSRAVTIADLREFATVDIDVEESRYREPLLRDARELVATLPPATEVVLLGSIATGKYVDLFDAVFRDRLLFPPEFVGRGDMSRGALLLRRAREGVELTYTGVVGAVRHGRRAATAAAPP